MRLSAIGTAAVMAVSSLAQVAIGTPLLQPVKVDSGTSYVEGGRLFGWTENNVQKLRLFGAAGSGSLSTNGLYLAAQSGSNSGTVQTLTGGTHAVAVHGRTPQGTTVPTVCGLGGEPLAEAPGYWTETATNTMVPFELSTFAVGASLRMNSFGDIVGYVVNTTDGTYLPFVRTGTTVSQLPLPASESQGQAQAIDLDGTTVAGWVSDASNTRRTSYWTWDGSAYVHHYVKDAFEQNVTGNVTEVDVASGAVPFVVVQGYTTGDRLFHHERFSSDNSLKKHVLLGKAGEVGAPQHSMYLQETPSLSAFVGNTASMPYLFVYPSDPASGDGYANDLASVMAPGFAGPAGSAKATGVAKVATFLWCMGGTDYDGDSTKDHWVLAPTGTYSFSTSRSVDVQVGTSSNIAGSAGIDGSAMVLTPHVGPAPTSDVFLYDVTESIEDATTAYFRTTQRFSNATGFKREFYLWNYSTGAWVKQTDTLNESDRMQTHDLSVTGPYISSTFEMKARVATVQTGIGLSNFKLEVEQARFIAP